MCYNKDIVKVNKIRYKEESLMELKLEKANSTTIKFKGYEPWYSVVYMTENWQREKCILWVKSLIEKGLIKKDNKNCNEINGKK